MPRLLTHHQDPPGALIPVIEEFLADCCLRGLDPTTIEWYMYAVLPFVRFATARGQTDVDCITEGTVRAFLAEKSTQVRPRRVDHYRQAVDRLHKWLIAEGRTEGDPAARFPRIRDGKRLMNAFAEAQVEALLAQPDTRTFILCVRLRAAALC